MKKLGIVFSGGGGKGAYEIGVWKYLREIGLEQSVSVVSGTSVGALNAALFVGSTFKEAEDLWCNITPDKILTPIMPESMLLTEGLFSREGLMSMIRENLNFEKLQESKIQCFVTCMRYRDDSIQRFKLNDYNKTDITTLLLASSAIPIVFPNEDFRGEKYCDGGCPPMGDNTPINPVYDLGIKNIIVVNLNREKKIDEKQYPDARIFQIVPSEDLGDLWTGTLNFTAENARKNMKLGYTDARSFFRTVFERMESGGGKEETRIIDLKPTTASSLVKKLIPTAGKLSRMHGIVHKRVDAEINGVKGSLVWDYIVYNEITFDDVEGNIYSLFKCDSDEETETVWNRYVGLYSVR